MPSLPRRTNKALVGALVGAVICIIILLATLYWLYRRRRRIVPVPGKQKQKFKEADESFDIDYRAPSIPKSTASAPDSRAWWDWKKSRQDSDIYRIDVIELPPLNAVPGTSSGQRSGQTRSGQTRATTRGPRRRETMRARFSRLLLALPGSSTNGSAFAPSTAGLTTEISERPSTRTHTTLSRFSEVRRHFRPMKTRRLTAIADRRALSKRGPHRFLQHLVCQSHCTSQTRLEALNLMLFIAIESRTDVMYP